jgi:LemA protein
MSSVIIALIVVVGMMLMVVVYISGVYNGLVTSANRYKNAFAQIDVQLKRRYDLIPNLVETVKGFIKHEQDTLTKVIEARNKAFSAGQAAASNPGDPTAMKNLGAAESQLTGALGRLLMIAEAYPELKANQNMLSLQEELTSTENKVSYARQGYNDAVTEYNTAREVFPAILFSGRFAFSEAQLLQIEKTEEREAPRIKF